MKGFYRIAFGTGLVAALFFTVPAVAQTERGAGVPSTTSETMPAWALPQDPNFKRPPPDDVLRHLPGSTAAFSKKQVRNLFFSPDWHPENHPPMPDVVARGRKPGVQACGSCHRAEGTGGPENASLAGLPATYIVQQMADFKSGARNVPTHWMVRIARAMTDDDVQAAADYFSSLPLNPNIKIVESDTIPKMYIAGDLFAKHPGGGTEMLGRRIVEVADNLEQFKLRDSRSQFTAYVPVGSIVKGEALVNGNIACAVCHGPGLKGLGPVPGIAGRSPTYMVRQLYNFKQGVRAGIGSALMKPQVEKLSLEDMISVAAYIGSLVP